MNAIHSSRRRIASLPVAIAAIAAALAMIPLQSCEFFGMDALSVVGHVPEGPLADMETLESIEVYFSANVNRKLTERAFSLQENGIQLSGSFTWPEGDHLAFTPHESLSPLASYDIKITADAEDVDGNSLESDFAHCFRGTPDSARPTILSITPANLSAVPSARPGITIVFSEAMNVPSVIDAFSLEPDADGYLVEALGDMAFSFVLTEDLAWQTLYAIGMMESAADASGNSLGAVPVSSFFVGSESTRPGIVSVSGNDSSLQLEKDNREDGRETVTGGLEKDTSIVIRFSEAMDCKSSEGSTSIVPGSWGKAEWNGGKDNLTLRPETPLVTGERYTLTVGSGSADSQGNLLQEDGVYVFEVTGPRSRRPTVSTVRFLNVFDGTGTPTGTVELSHAGAITFAAPFNAGTVEAFFDVYLVLAESATVDLYDFIESFSIRATNADIEAVGCKSNDDISFHSADVPPIPGFYPSSGVHVFRYVVNIDNSGPYADNPGYIILSLDTALRDSLGNPVGDKWSMMVTTTN